MTNFKFGVSSIFQKNLTLKLNPQPAHGTGADEVQIVETGHSDFGRVYAQDGWLRVVPPGLGFRV
jgi:hypothetical protein